MLSPPTWAQLSALISVLDSTPVVPKPLLPPEPWADGEEGIKAARVGLLYGAASRSLRE